MCCLSLRFPVSARRAWKRFKSKVQITKLWKPQRSKAIKKPKSVIKKSKVVMKTAEASNIHSLFKRRRKRLPSHQKLYLNKTSGPVYIDRIFKEPVVSERACFADDMWESLGLASPLVEGIDERAEEFILRFRAEMELQEIMARSL